MSFSCIFCNKHDSLETVEHIIPRSLGNLHYVLPKGAVCYTCNNKFSRFEKKVLTSDEFLKMRLKYGLIKNEDKFVSNPISEKSLVKFVLKMGYEAMYLSRNKEWKNINWQNLINCLHQNEWSHIFSNERKFKVNEFKPIPRWFNRFRLRNNHLHLRYARKEKQVYFQFQFGEIQVTVRGA